jgi:hypothetical protein
MEERESVVVGTLAIGYLAVALALAFALPSGRELDPVVVLGLLAASVGVSLIRFDVGAGYVCAEQLVYVPLLFFAPLPLVLLLVPVAYALSDLPDFLAGRAHRDRWMNALADSWFAIGSVTVLGLFAPGPPQLELAPVYLGAVAAQVGLGTSAALAREYFVGRLSVRDELRSAAAAYQLDVMLSPIGLAVAFAATELGSLALLGLVPGAGALYWLSVEHRERCDRLVAEHEAYWRRFLRDARRLERCAKPDVSDDWQSMPELALAVCAELRLDLDVQAGIAQAAQTAARRAFHDPADPPDRRLRLAAALIAGRFAQLGTDPLVSTLAAERLREQAELVRLSRERYDGRGSASALRGDEIPLGSRIIACCQAYGEFTAAAPDRAPMSGEIAVEELRRDAGRRFDPDIVGALARALRQEELGEPPTPTRSPWLIDQLRPAGPAALGGRTTTVG